MSCPLVSLVEGGGMRSRFTEQFDGLGGVGGGCAAGNERGLNAAKMVKITSTIW